MKSQPFVRGLVCALACALASAPARAQEAPPSSELQVLRQELAAVKADYASRIAALEARLATLEAQPAAIPTSAAQAAPAPGSSKLFNPDIAVIGNVVGSAGSNDTPFAPPALSLDEAEVSLQAVIDPYARADFFLTFKDDEVGVEVPVEPHDRPVTAAVSPSGIARFAATF